MKKKILITGFEPFDNDVSNPSGDWINWMEDKEINSDRVFKGITLPVTFEGSFRLFKEHYDEFCPDVVILTGLAKNRTSLTVERIGINWVDARIPDNDGVILLSQKIDSEGSDGIFTTIPFNIIPGEIKISTSAGEYVCNYLLYKALCYCQNKNTQVTFLHLPGAANYDGIYLALLTLLNAV